VTLAPVGCAKCKRGIMELHGEDVSDNTANGSMQYLVIVKVNIVL
jgi:hypothetical protein